MSKVGTKEKNESKVTLSLGREKEEKILPRSNENLNKYHKQLEELIERVHEKPGSLREMLDLLIEDEKKLKKKLEEIGYEDENEEILKMLQQALIKIKELVEETGTELKMKIEIALNEFQDSKLLSMIYDVLESLVVNDKRTSIIPPDEDVRL
jgi:predicted nuclease with TOPRIM domain